MINDFPESRMEAKTENLEQKRDELDLFVLSGSDEVEEKVDMCDSSTLDIPSEVEGVSVSPYFKGTYYVLFEIDLNSRSEPQHSKHCARSKLHDEMIAVKRVCGAEKLTRHSEKGKKKREKLREKIELLTKRRKVNE